MDTVLVDKKYKLGYCMGAFNHAQIEQYEWLKEKTSLCDNFILGIPDEWVMARLFGDGKPYDVKKEKQLWMETGWFSDVIILDAEHLNYRKIYKDIQFDVCFFGAKYGRLFEEDKDFMEEYGVSFISVIPERHIGIGGGGALGLSLENVQRKQKIILFGTGAYFDIYMNEYAKLKKKYLPAYAIDNDPDKWDREKNGIKILNPIVLQKEKAEDLLVVVCSKNSEEMIQQLNEWGNFNYRTLCFANEIALLEEFAITSANEREYLKKVHGILKILMAEFDRVCQENHLHYYVICGSLIGVVRHKDMIPWDDDIDIAMPRKDYKKLKRIAKKEWNNDAFQLLGYADIGGDAFLDCMPRLFYMKEHLPLKCFDLVYGKAKDDLMDRAFLDIYVLDNAHENEIIHNLTIGAMKGIYNLMMGHRAIINYDEYKALVSEKTIKLMKLLNSIGRVFPIHFLAFWYDFFARSANLNPKCRYYIMESCAIRCIELKYPKKDYGEGLRLPFSDIEVMVPSDYDAQLKAMRYRNYMEFPRMSIRKPSHYFNSDIEIW